MHVFTELIEPDSATLLGELRLTYEWRQKSRFRAPLVSGAAAGDDVGVLLARGRVLREGQWLGCRQTPSGPIVAAIRIRAAIEQLLQVTAVDHLGLARIAYHLGNRHVSVQIGQGSDADPAQLWLRLQLDHVLENMVQGLGGNMQVLSAPFDPESGAYSHEHGVGAHVHPEAAAPTLQPPAYDAAAFEDRRFAPRIHDFLG